MKCLTSLLTGEVTGAIGQNTNIVFQTKLVGTFTSQWHQKLCAGSTMYTETEGDTGILGKCDSWQNIWWNNNIFPPSSPYWYDVCWVGQGELFPQPLKVLVPPPHLVLALGKAVGP